MLNACTSSCRIEFLELGIGLGVVLIELHKFSWVWLAIAKLEDLGLRDHYPDMRDFLFERPTGESIV
jgi:hypothetical protein